MTTAKETEHVEADPIPSPYAKRSRPMDSPGGRSEPDSVRPHVADADKVARTGSKDESVPNTPPAGDWNEDA